MSRFKRVTDSISGWVSLGQHGASRKLPSFWRPRTAIFGYIELFNRKRIHPSLGYRMQARMERAWQGAD